MPRKSLPKGMARKKNFSAPPKTPMNQWFRDALDHMSDRGQAMTYDEIAAALSRQKIGAVYDKSIVQKMTTMRKISLTEASALSALTGYPLPDHDASAESLDERKSRLSAARQTRLLEYLAELEALERAAITDQEKPPSKDDSAA